MNVPRISCPPAAQCACCLIKYLAQNLFHICLDIGVHAPAPFEKVSPCGLSEKFDHLGELVFGELPVCMAFILLLPSRAMLLVDLEQHFLGAGHAKLEPCRRKQIPRDKVALINACLGTAQF